MLYLSWNLRGGRFLLEAELFRRCGRPHKGFSLDYDRDEENIELVYHTVFGCVALTKFKYSDAERAAILERAIAADDLYTTGKTALIEDIIRRNGGSVTRIQVTTHEASDFSGIPVSVFDQDERRN